MERVVKELHGTKVGDGDVVEDLGQLTDDVAVGTKAAGMRSALQDHQCSCSEEGRGPGCRGLSSCPQVPPVYLTTMGIFSEQQEARKKREEKEARKLQHAQRDS